MAGERDVGGVGLGEALAEVDALLGAGQQAAAVARVQRLAEVWASTPPTCVLLVLAQSVQFLFGGGGELCQRNRRQVGEVGEPDPSNNSHL